MLQVLENQSSRVFCFSIAHTIIKFSWPYPFPERADGHPSLVKLTTRFVILTCVLGLAVVISLGVAYWGVASVDREVRSSYGQIAGIMSKLETIKSNFEHQMQALESESFRRFPDEFSTQGTGEMPPSLVPFDPDQARSLMRQTRQTVRDLDVDWTFREFTGVQASRSVRSQARSLVTKLENCYEALTQNDATEAVRCYLVARSHFEQLHLLIEGIEGRLVDDINLSLDFAEETRTQVNLVLVSCLLVAGLVITLVLLLQRRWFNQPIRSLREATTELSKGNFEHRAPVLARDELGLLSEEINEMAQTITEIQIQLVERERLAAVGEMMRRIVHNLRNPLAGIRSLAELTQSELRPDSGEFENQRRILATVDQFEKWLEEVLHTTRPLEVRPMPVNPAIFLDSLVVPQRAAAEAKSIKLVIEAENAPEKANVDQMHFHHALVALIANAIEACPEGADIRIIGREVFDNRRSMVSRNGNPESGGRLWEIIVEDSGPGIDPDLRNRVFEPYFTTKKGGFGIGLAVVRNVVRAHRGEIDVSASEMGGHASQSRCRADVRPHGATNGKNCHH